jgi:hypothetical protein
MRSFSVARSPAGDFVFSVEVSPAGYAALGAYTLLVGIDVDRNATTGNTGYAVFHGLAPEVELRYTVAPGQAPQSSVRLYSAGAAGLGDAGLVEWRAVDATRLQATVKPALLSNATAFWVVTDLQISDRYDHIPDNARVAFPENRLLPR